MKKLIKWLIIIIVILAILLTASYFIFVNWYAKSLIESQIEKQVNRDVEISVMHINLLSSEPSINIKGLTIANQLLSDQKPTKKSDSFVSIESIQLLLKLKPLLKKQFELTSLLIKSPDIRLIRYPDGRFNFSDLLDSKKSERPGKDPIPPQTDEIQKAPQPQKQPPEPQQKKTASPQINDQFCADDLPFQIIISNLGIDKAHIQLFDQQYQQMIHINDMDILVHDVNINPKNLENENIVRFDASLNIQTEGKLKSGWAKSFNIDLICESAIRPFDPKTRLLNPHATIKTGSPSGQISGLQIYEILRSKLMNVKIAALDFLKDDLKWKKGVVNLIANQDVVSLNEGAFYVEDMMVNLDGQYLLKKKGVDIALDILLPAEEQQKIERKINEFISKQVSFKHRKYVKVDEISQNILDAIIAKDGRIHIIFSVSGSIQKPKVHLVQPQFPAIDSIIAETLGNIKSQLMEQARNKAQKEVDRLKQKAQKEIHRAVDKLNIPDEQKNVLENIKDKVLDSLPFSF